MKRQTALALYLNWIAGYVDAVGFIAFFHVYLGNMTGNTIAVAEGLIEHRPELILKRGLAIPEFFVGLVLSRILVELLARRKVSHIGAIVYGLEVLVLFALAIVGSTEPLALYLLIGLGSFAMGLQNAAQTHFGPLDVRTTHVTGTISKLADHLVKFLLAGGDRTSEREKAVLYLAMWAFYLVGGIIGLALLHAWVLDSLYVPAGFLLVAVAMDLWKPLS